MLNTNYSYNPLQFDLSNAQDSCRTCYFIPHYVLKDLAIFNNINIDEGLSNSSTTMAFGASENRLEPKRIIKIRLTPQLLRNERIRATAEPLIKHSNIVIPSSSEPLPAVSEHLHFNLSTTTRPSILQPLSGASEDLLLNLDATISTSSESLVVAGAIVPRFPVYDLNGATEYFNEYKNAVKESSLLKGDFNQWPKHAINARETAEKVYQFYKSLYSRNSIDGKGMDIISCVRLRTYLVHHDPHTGRDEIATDSYGHRIRMPENNAFWDGSVIAYGEGDGMVFTDFTASQDVIGHELTHGVTQHTCNLRYEGQSGALNEHISDVFGATFRQKEENMSDPTTANWLIGDKCISEDFKKMVKVRNFGHWDALRSMAEPGTAYNVERDSSAGNDPQPNHMNRYYSGPSDHQGVHINSGIPNKAFYLFAKAVGEPAWETPAKIWYTTIVEAQFGKIEEHPNNPALRERVATFKEFARATIVIAERDFLKHKDELEKAWIEVGVLKNSAMNVTSNLGNLDPIIQPTDNTESIKKQALHVPFKDLGNFGVPAENLKKLTSKAEVLTLEKLQDIINNNKTHRNTTVHHLDKADIDSIKEAFNFPDDNDQDNELMTAGGKHRAPKGGKGGGLLGGVLWAAAKDAADWYFNTPAY